MSQAVERNVNFMGVRRIATILSLVLVLVSIVSLSWKGLVLGLDFTGGTLVEVEYQSAPDLPTLRSRLTETGHEKFIVQSFGADTAVLFRFGSNLGDEKVAKLMSVLSNDGQTPVTLKRTDVVGSQVGDELKESGGLGLLLALAMVMVYVAIRFQFKFSIAAVVPLVHDVIVVLGIFSVLNWEFDLTVMAAILAVVGYSINDTIIVADRIRENFRRLRIDDPVEVVNLSLNQTFGRTMVTSGTTLLAVLALVLFGGEMIRGFSVALLIGIVVGTYSSIYVSASLLLAMNVSRQDLLVPVKDDNNQEEEAPPAWLDRMK